MLARTAKREGEGGVLEAHKREKQRQGGATRRDARPHRREREGGALEARVREKSEGREARERDRSLIFFMCESMGRAGDAGGPRSGWTDTL
jgi:hypothetical protein